MLVLRPPRSVAVAAVAPRADFSPTAERPRRDRAPALEAHSARRHDPIDQSASAAQLAPVRLRPRVRRRGRLPDDDLPSWRVDDRIHRRSAVACLGARYQHARRGECEASFQPRPLCRYRQRYRTRTRPSAHRQARGEAGVGTRSPRETFGDAVVNEITAAQPDGVIWNTSTQGNRTNSR